MATYRHIRDFIMLECTRLFRPFTNYSVPTDTLSIYQPSVVTPLCTKCLHYKPRIINGIIADNKIGYCKRSARIDIVQGSPTYGTIVHEPIQKYYQQSCKGDMYTELLSKK